MKQVFVETNFLIALARPNPEAGAERLFHRNGTDVELHLPWCCAPEAVRTLDRVIDDDLGFESAMMKRALVERRDGDLALHALLQRFAQKVRGDRQIAKANVEQAIAAVAGNLKVIPPSVTVISETLRIFTVKTLKPFDEMVLGAILAKAGELHAAGERELYFCNLNKNDFSPVDGAGQVSRPSLHAEYKKYGLTYKSSFDVP